MLMTVALAMLASACGGDDGNDGVDAAPPPVDTDGDEVLDHLDNCPMLANAGQENEDADAAGDACDNCLTRSNDDQVDGDGDDLGDVCDPRPQAAGDRLVFFDGFNQEGGLPADWTLASGGTNDPGNWSVSGGKLVQQASSDQPTSIFVGGGDVLARAVIETQVTLDSLPADNMLTPAPYVGVLAAFDNAAATDGVDDGYNCQIEKGNPGPQTRLRITSIAISDAQPEEVTQWSFQQEGQYRIVMQQQPADELSTITCQAAKEDVNADFERTLEGPKEGRVGLQTRRAAAKFDYFVVYEVGSTM